MVDPRPNILWISLEDTTPRYGCYGDPVARTPNLNRLAAGGCIYPNAFSTAGVCAPSRASIITGCYAPSIGAHHMRTAHTNRSTPELPTPYECCPPPHVKCFPEYLRASGYFCTNNHKTDYQFTPPVTAWDECHPQAHWRHRAPGQPFFAVFNPTLTHESGMWPEKAEPEPITDPDDVVLPPYLPNTRKAREALARQYDHLHQSDKLVGELLDQLEADGLADNTIVVHWSDHGEGLPRSKRWLYDGGIRIPLIVRWPGQVEPGTTSDQLVSLIDLAPTMLSVAGAPVPAHLQGQPFLGPAKQEREVIFAARDRFDEAYDRVRAARDKRFKYLRNYYPEKPYLLWIPYHNRHPIVEELWRLHGAGELNEDQQALFRYPRPVEELYDTQADPFELRNLAAEPHHAANLARLRAAMDAWQNTCGDLGAEAEEQMVRRWFPDGTQPVTAAPIFIPIAAGSYGREAASEGSYPAPALLQLHCATHGASIAWTAEQGEQSRWQLYTEPLALPAGESVIRAKAIRIGYAESEERVGRFTVMG